MALTINTQILGQEAVDGAAYTYCYLYEPLKVSINESDLTATKMYIDLQIRDTTQDYTVIDTLVEYADFDINSGEALSIDLMKIVQQYHDANVYKFGDVDDISIGDDGFKSVVSEYKYVLSIYTDKTATPIVVKKLPIIGVRMLEQFTPVVPTNTPLTEFEYYGLDISELQSRWDNVSYIDTSLESATSTDASPTIIKEHTDVEPPVNALKRGPCGSFLIWKSRFGGWMFWGFDLKQRSFSKSYEGSLEVGMFESTKDADGNPFIPVSYSGINTSYSLTLKSLGLTANELLAVSGINASPAVYLLEDYILDDSGNSISDGINRDFSLDVANVNDFESNYNWSTLGSVTISITSQVLSLNTPGIDDGLILPGKYERGSRYRIIFKLVGSNSGNWHIMFGSTYIFSIPVGGGTIDEFLDLSDSINSNEISIVSDTVVGGGDDLVIDGTTDVSMEFIGPRSKIELMKLTSMSAPISSLSDGGDFSVTLQSISKTSQKTI